MLLKKLGRRKEPLRLVEHQLACNEHNITWEMGHKQYRLMKGIAAVEARDTSGNLHWKIRFYLQLERCSDQPLVFKPQAAVSGEGDRVNDILSGVDTGI
ncbi:MAG: hypothetical protein JXR49_02955 [Acidobacteria bacterium]|nr:hypothetical protein [Acidobacteriota bacterium]